MALSRAHMSLMSLIFAASTGRAQEPLPPPLPPEGPLPGSVPSLEAPLETEPPEPGTRTVTLAEAVAHALEHNFALLDADDSLRAARWNERAGAAQFRPRLTPGLERSDDETRFALEGSQRLPWLGGNLTGQADFRSRDTVGPAPAGRFSDLRLELRQPLLRGFGPSATYFQLRNLRRQRVSQERNLVLQRQNLAVAVTQAFYAVVRQRALVGVSRQSLARTKELLAASEARMEVGLASKLDVFRAELQAAQTEDALVQVRASLEQSLESFRGLLGLPPGASVEPATLPLQPPAAAITVPPLEELLADARSRRLELREAQDRIEDAERAAGLARQNLLPQLDLSLSVSKLGFGSTYRQSFDNSDTRWNLFVSTSYPLDRSFDKATSAISQLEVDARKRALRQRDQEVEADVRAAARRIERIRQSVVLQQKSVAFAEQQLRLASLRYQRGLASNFDVVEAEGNWVGARSALVLLLSELQVARVELARAVGTLDVALEFAS